MFCLVQADKRWRAQSTEKREVHRLEDTHKREMIAMTLETKVHGDVRGSMRVRDTKGATT